MSVYSTAGNNRIGRLVDSPMPLRRLIIILLHAGLVAGGYWLAFVLRFEFPLAPEDWRQLLQTLPLILVLRLVVFYRFHMYEEVWRYVSMRDILTILKAVTLSSLVFALAVLGLINPDFPWPIFPIDWGTCLLFVGGGRLAIRALRESAMDGHPRAKRALVVGAGDAADMLMREIGRNPGLPYNVIGFVDDDPAKQGRRIHGRKVLGDIDGLPELCRTHSVHELLIAIPSATGEQMRRIIRICRSARVEFKTVPGVGEMIENGGMLSKVRRVQVSDLLRREPVRIDRTEIEGFIRGKRVLVTGAGGSIGSELCRQLAGFEPETLVLLDKAENSLFFVEMELRQRYPKLSISPVVGDVTDKSRMAGVFQEHKPQIVFHAAAHKHVPLMELNKAEAVKNNVLGTKVVADAAWRNRVEDFVMISTDKAVRPSSVMGATKRLAEMYVQSLNANIQTRFMTVRFGNVLGSDGSVLQVFQKQIEAGWPVTITHPDMKRYFMTIPEASQLVLQAATLGQGGEIFVLDMGEPVKIVDLARDLIVLSGLEPEKDIPIEFIGPRPGEKLFEELLNPETRVLPTAHEKIMVVETDPVDYDTLQIGIAKLLRHAVIGDEPALLAGLASLVPDYVKGKDHELPPGEKGQRILLVEHDPYTRTTLKRILEGHYHVFEAENRRQALLRMNECRPDLVILDFHLPNTNIRRLCARLKAEARHGTGGPGEQGSRGAGEGETGGQGDKGKRRNGEAENGEQRTESRVTREGETEKRGNGEAEARGGGDGGAGEARIILLMETADTVSLDDVHALGAHDRLYKPLPVSILEKRVRDLLANSSIHAVTASQPNDT
jgi:FlaA1/EpsC-like NDP-sugar epimerase